MPIREFGTTAEPVPSKFSSISYYMFMLMIRNFATDQWIFSKDVNGSRLVSRPGCIIASPSVPGDAETTEDYVHFWVRDGALTVTECLYYDLPSNEMLNDYVRFSRRIQQNAIEARRPTHACFKIDGSLREWGDQSDGVALRILSILDIWNGLNDDVKLLARTVLSEDQDCIAGSYRDKTDNVWEEVYGYSFFARAAQRRAMERLGLASSKVGVTPHPNSKEIVDYLSQQLDAHWNESKGHYVSILDGRGTTGPLRGDQLNADLLFPCTYAGMRSFDERMLRTAAKVREAFEVLYPINVSDGRSEMGPSIGRYPEDTYDGTIHEGDDRGHPWPLCTANLARFYYQVMIELTVQPEIVITDGMRPFFNQIGFTAIGLISKSSLHYKDLLGALLTAGDRLMRAVVYHSDHLELSEQNDRDTGNCTSVRSLTWSYSSFLTASRAREVALRAI